ncbi:MAG: DUF2254 domain-containing protein [Phycisphaerae bacterium]|nr:DUF2254 domain-containing protein [Phycisphaerae bacterium]
MAKLLSIWHSLRSSLWLVPGVLVLLAVALAIGLIEVDSRLDERVLDSWPRLFGAGAAGSRGMLVAVASSMITVAGVVFSITLVALSLASSQYTSRVLRQFMSDRTNQTVLGVFVGIFAYCLVVLRTIREGPDIEFVPSLAVLGGVVLAFIGIGYFSYFIHHIATTIQASHVLARNAAESVRRIDHLFPDGVAHEDEFDANCDPSRRDPRRRWHAAPAPRTGYIQRVEAESLLAVARNQKTVVRMENRVGDFVVEGMPLASILTAEDSGPPSQEVIDRVSAAYAINAERTTDQDAAYGIRQIVDVALKALSPGINDTTTAVMSLDYLTAILVKLCARRIESTGRFDKGELRVITRGATFASMVELAFDQIRQNAGGNVAVLSRLVEALQTLEGQTQRPNRRRVLLHQALALEEVIRRTIPASLDREPVQARALRLLESLKAFEAARDMTTDHY